MENDKRKNNGGHSNGGRKPKAEEQKLIEKLSPMEATAHAKLSEAIELGKDWAIKMFFEYMYGKPKQIIEQTNLTPFTEIILVDATKDSNS
jgi:hypothetical protein